jgi:hypothetical protein
VLPITKVIANQPSKMKKNVARVFRNQRKNAKKCAKGKIIPFLSLPRELRDIIIGYSIDYNGIDSKILEVNDSFPSNILWTPEFPVIYSEWMEHLDQSFSCNTPTILLLNYQVYKEAQEILKKKIMRIANPPQYPFPGEFVLSRFIGGNADVPFQVSSFCPGLSAAMLSRMSRKPSSCFARILLPYESPMIFATIGKVRIFSQTNDLRTATPGLCFLKSASISGEGLSKISLSRYSLTTALAADLNIICCCLETRCVRNVNIELFVNPDAGSGL